MFYGVHLVGEVDTVGFVHARHVGNDNLVAFFQPVKDLDRVHGGAAELYHDTLSFFAIIDNLKHGT